MHTLIVTGASRGIGRAVAQLASARGYAVIVNYNQDAAGAATVVDAIRATGGTAHAIQGDVSREHDVVHMFEEAEQIFGPTAALVNNAGITGGFARVSDLTSKTIERVLAVNVTGTILCAREAVRRMSTRSGGQGGTIVNISSRAAQIGSSGEWVHYAASKGAVDSFTIGLAREVAAEGIRVNGVAAGLINTGLHAAAGDPGRLERMAKTIPIQRAGEPLEVAEAVLWLLSDAASYVTGTIVGVSGGR